MADNGLLARQPAPRSSLAVTLSVWRALMLREALSRLFATRISWAWLLFEPVFHVAYLLLLYGAAHVHSIGNLDTPIWIMVGIQAYFLFRKTADQVAGAAADNGALFAYRQVRPIDTLIARAARRGHLGGGDALAGPRSRPDQPRVPARFSAGNDWCSPCDVAARPRLRHGRLGRHGPDARKPP